jgi:CheY-like chemotaxis protein
MKAESAQQTGATGRVLVVDDYPMNCLKLARVLEQLGQTVQPHGATSTAAVVSVLPGLDIVSFYDIINIKLGNSSNHGLRCSEKKEARIVS